MTERPSIALSMLGLLVGIAISGYAFGLSAPLMLTSGACTAIGWFVCYWQHSALRRRRPD